MAEAREAMAVDNDGGGDGTLRVSYYEYEYSYRGCPCARRIFNGWPLSRHHDVVGRCAGGLHLQAQLRRL